MKRIGTPYIGLTAVLLLTAFLAWTEPTEAAQPVTFRVTQILVANNPINKAFVSFQQEVTKATNGRILWENYFMGSLVRAGEELDSLKRGLVDVAGIWLNQYSSQLPLNGYNYAMIFCPSDPVMLVKMAVQMRKDFPDLEKEQEKYNGRIMFVYPVDSLELLTKKPVKTIDDLKGMKIAASGYWHPKALAAVGAVPLDIPAAQRYTALQTGLIEGSLLGITATDDRKMQELAQNLTLIGMGAQFGQWVIRLDSWNGLSAKEKQIVEEAASRWEIKGAEVAQPIRDAVIEKWKKAGVSVTELPAAEKIKWGEKIKGIPWQYAKDNDAKGFPGTKLVETYFRVVKNAGYKFPVDYTKP